MGLFDRFAKAVADNITKAPLNLPAGAVTMTEQEMRNSQLSGTYVSQPLPRNPMLAGVPFSPGVPLQPGAINPVDADGRALPRRYEFTVAQNINVNTENKLVPFKTLRAAADQIDIARRCLEVLKAKISGLEWDITLAADSQEKIISESNDSNYVRALSKAREELNDEIYKARTFWENPDKSNGLTFMDWLMIALEEILVIDALAIFPQMTVGGDLYGLQILDGSTIKPLLDDRGMRPMSPQPAYQQILYGFPRTEFSAASDEPDADGEFTAENLIYLIRNRRAASNYGYSPVERALPLLDLYLRRQQWLRAEYTDGVMPETLFTTDAEWGNDPAVLKAYENIFNDDLAGQTEQRKRGRFLPTGVKPEFQEGYGEKFKATLDDYLVTSITGHFGVLPTEIGFSAKGGIGASGHQAGEADSAQAIGVEPLVNWLAKMITNISYSYLGMPRELEFKFMPSDKMDNESTAKKSDLEIRGATKTINERRSELGLPLLDTPAADQPILVTGTSVYLFSPNGIVDVAAASTAGDVDSTGADAPEKPEPTPPIPGQPVPGQPVPPVPGKPDAKPLPASKDKAGIPDKAKIKDALARLEVLPNLAGSHPTTDSQEQLMDEVASPWQTLETNDGVYTVDPDVWQKAVLTLVTIKDLIGTNIMMDRSNVAEHIESAGQAITEYRNYPLIFNDGEQNIIIDGHHRLFAMMLLGMDTAPVWLGTADMAKAMNAEARAFLKWAKKGSASRRPFEFKSIDPIVGEALNRCAYENDMDTVRSLVKAYLT